MRLFYLFLTFIFTASVEGSSTINWLDSYEKAVEQSKTSKKPLLIFFTGSDWCGWCHKLENEVLDTPTFAQNVGDTFIFLIADFPMKKSLDETKTAQNSELQRTFDVKGFPTLVILDEQQQPIGTTGYRPGGAKAYSDHLLQMINEHRTYKQKVSLLPQSTLSTEELTALYQTARRLERYDEANKILQLGLRAKDNRFFLLERFRLLADEGQIHDLEAQTTRQKLLTQDPQNEFKTHYAIAVIEFEAFAEEMEKNHYAPDLAVAPLIAYVEQFGDTDQENLWKLHMIISQVFLDGGKNKEALKHAQAAHAAAPETVQPDIQIFIQNLQGNSINETANR